MPFVMNQLRDAAANKLDHIPKRLDTTKRRVKEQLPLLELRKKPIPLIKEQLPSSIGGEAVPNVPTKDLTFFILLSYFVGYSRLSFGQSCIVAWLSLKMRRENFGRLTDGLVQSAQHAANMPILLAPVNQSFRPIGFIGRQLKGNVSAVSVPWVDIKCRQSELG
jgi:hypothetical protein